MSFGKKNREISIYHATFVDLFASISAIFVIMTMVLMAQSQLKANKAAETLPPSTPAQSNPEKSFQQTVEQMKVGEKMQLPQVYFYPGVDQLLPGAFETLQNLASVLEKNRHLKLEVRGFIHAQPDEHISASDEAVAQKRADRVCTELTQMGAEKDQLVCKGMGASELKIQTTDYYKAGMNRRVEILVLEKSQ